MIPRRKTGFVKDALFVSYTGLKDFLRCQRTYFLKNRYKNSKGYKIQIVSPSLTLGSVLHDAIKWYLQTNRTAGKDQLIKYYRSRWLNYRGKRGGFDSSEEEGSFGKRGLQILDNFMNNAAKLESNMPVYDFLRYQLAEKIILTGKLDFLGQLPDGSLHVLDFKTGQKEETDPTQLRTYAVLAEGTLQRPVTKISYWYIDKDDNPKEAVLDSLDAQMEWLTEKCREIELAVARDEWVCAKGEDQCDDCRRYQAIIDGKGEFQYSDDDFKKEIYYLPRDY